MTDDVRALFNETILGTLATVNEDGSPWASPLHVFTDNEAVYWFSGSTRQHSLNIASEPRVSLAIFSPDESKGPKGAYFNGTVETLDEAKTEHAKHLVVSRLGKLPPVFEKATAYRLAIGEFNSGKSSGNCWYFYS